MGMFIYISPIKNTHTNNQNFVSSGIKCKYFWPPIYNDKANTIFSKDNFCQSLIIIITFIQDIEYILPVKSKQLQLNINSYSVLLGLYLINKVGWGGRKCPQTVSL